MRTESRVSEVGSPRRSTVIAPLRGRSALVRRASQMTNADRAPGGPATGQMSRRYAGGVRRTRPETIPGPGRQTVTIRIVDSCSGQQDLRAGSAPVLWAKRDSPTRLRRPSAPDFFFLVRRQTESTIGRLQKPINKPIILQVPNRDSNFVKMIRPVQGTFSGLQHPPDSDRFTLLIRRLGVRIPRGAPGQRLRWD